MNSQLHMISFAMLFISNTSQAQLNRKYFSWGIAGEIPAYNQDAPSPGVAGPVTGFHNGVIMVGGGANFPDSMPWEGGKKKYHQALFVFKSVGKKLLPVEGTFQLPEPVAYAATCTTPSGVFFAGGENERGITDKVYILKWDKRKHVISIEKLPDLPVGLVNAACTAEGNQVFIAGGETRESVTAKCWTLDLGESRTAWKELPALPVAVSHSVMVTMRKGKDIKLYLLGGRQKKTGEISVFYQSVYRLELDQQGWSPLPPLPYPLSAGTGVAARESGVYLFGGDRGTVFGKVEGSLLAISRENRAKEKEALVEQKNDLLRTHPGFSGDIIFYNSITGVATIAGQIPYPTPVTTTAFWYRGAVIIPSGEIRAGVRSPKILIAKILPQKP